MILTQQKLPSSILVVNNTANKSMLLRTETPLLLCVGLSQLPVPESQLVLLHPTLLNPKAVKLIQKRYPCTGNLNSGSPGDSKHAFLHCEDVSGVGCDASGAPSQQKHGAKNRNPTSAFSWFVAAACG